MCTQVAKYLNESVEVYRQHYIHATSISVSEGFDLRHSICSADGYERADRRQRLLPCGSAVRI